MNRHLLKIKNDVSDASSQAWSWFKELPVWKKAAVIAVLVAVVSLLVHFLSGKKEVQQDIVKAPRAITLASVGELSSNLTPLPITGTVTSRSEAVIRGESSGQITVYKKLGDYVGAGGVVASFENAGERAQVVQAEGAYDGAKAARDIAHINQGSVTVSLSATKTSVLNTFSSVYTMLDDAVRVKSDMVFTNPQNSQIKFAFTVPNQSLIFNIERERTAVEKILVGREIHNAGLSENSALADELNTLEEEAKVVQRLLDDISNALSHAIPDAATSQGDIDIARGSVNGARSSVNGALSAITGARNGWNQATTASETAGNDNGAVSTGGSAAADAQVKSALGNLQAAQARLEKTIVRSPISGTINSLSVQTGDFVSNFSPIAVVSNNGALEVAAYVTDTDAAAVAVGSKVLIDGNVDGVVTKVAPALDPLTKKIEVRIGITGTNGALINGKSVRVDITRTNTSENIKTADMRLPLSAIKITPNGSFVFTVDVDNKLVAHPIKEGTIMGEQIGIISGVTSDMKIVTDARGLKEGMVITVK